MAVKYRISLMRRAHGSPLRHHRSIKVMGVDLKNGIRLNELKEYGSTTGMSFVVLIVGQATFDPALQPI